MSINAQTYLKALYPLALQPIHLSDEDVAEILEKELKRSQAARRAAETRKKTAEKKKEAQHD